MNNCRFCKKHMIDAYYNELNPADKNLFDRHLKECESCASQWYALRETMDMMNDPVQQEPGNDYWDTYQDILEAKMRPAPQQQSRFSRLSRQIEDLFRPVPSWTLQAAAAAFILVIGIYLGRMTGRGTDGTGPVSGPSASNITLTSSPDQRTDSYLERSKLLLLAFVNFDPETQDLYTLNLPMQKKISQQLVKESGELKQVLNNPEERRLRSLISDLEIILMQIANLEQEKNLSAVELVKSGVDKRGLLFKINLQNIKKTQAPSFSHNKTNQSI